MNLDGIKEKLLAGGHIKQEEACGLASLEGPDLFDFFGMANRLREKRFGRQVSLCAIINAKSGKCPEDCSFCAQSSHHNTNIESYPLVDRNKILEAARAAREIGAIEFSIVTSGYGIEKDTEVAGIEEGIHTIRKNAGMMACASPGIVSESVLKRFKEAGLNFYHHNLETARSFFPQVCSTHHYEEDVEAVRRAKSLKLNVCCGGIFGLGETWEQRVELFFTLRELDVDSVPINFLNPIQGTPLEGNRNLNPMDCLKIIALARAILPDKKITICGGREVNLRDHQGMIFFAGANATMVGNYLTTKGRPAENDIQMIRDAGMEVMRL
jgi:biotin synthase